MDLADKRSASELHAPRVIVGIRRARDGMMLTLDNAALLSQKPNECQIEFPRTFEIELPELFVALFQRTLRWGFRFRIVCARQAPLPVWPASARPSSIQVPRWPTRLAANVFQSVASPWDNWIP